MQQLRVKARDQPRQKALVCKSVSKRSLKSKQIIISLFHCHIVTVFNMQHEHFLPSATKNDITYKKNDDDAKNIQPQQTTDGAAIDIIAE